jgi:predicted MPP superfamily phosphohydrolase
MPSQPRFLVFRFSDAKREPDRPEEPIPTIERHQESAAANGGKVWWGWWRKGSESDKAEVFEAFSKGKSLPTDVGLIDRVLEPDQWRSRLYAATCHEVVYSPDGSRVRSPNAAWTPAYYREDEHPAWVLLSDIREVDQDTWCNKFLGLKVPLGNSTLYWVEADKPGQQFPAAPRIVTHCSPHSSVLHLSDLHFGAEHDFRADPNTPTPSMVDAVLDAVRALDVKIGVVVISGDFTTKSDTEPYLHEAPEQITKLMRALGLDKRHHLLVVPGNHDIDLANGDTNYTHETNYKEFLRHLFEQVDEIEDLEQGLRLTCRDGWRLTFVGFNSVKPRDTVFADYGYVGRGRVDTMLRELEDADSEGRALIFAVMHHHLLPVEPMVTPNKDRKASITLDAGELIEVFQANRVDAVLHGHQHTPFIGRGDRTRRVSGMLIGEQGESLWVLGAGTAGSKLLPPTLRHGFSVYTPSDAGLRVRIVEFGSNRDIEIVADVILAMRARRAATAERAATDALSTTSG